MFQVVAQSLPRRVRIPHPYKTDPSHRFALIGIRVERLARDRGLDVSPGHSRRALLTCQYTVRDVDTTQLCAFIVLSSDNQKVKVDLDPLRRKDDGASLLKIGDWRVLPGQLSIHRRPGDFVCTCLVTSSRAPCHSCFGPTGDDHYLVSDFSVSHIVPRAAASGIPFGPVPDEFRESALRDFSGATETPMLGSAGTSGSGTFAGPSALGSEAGVSPLPSPILPLLITPLSCFRSLLRLWGWPSYQALPRAGGRVGSGYVVWMSQLFSRRRSG